MALHRNIGYISLSDVADDLMIRTNSIDEHYVPADDLIRPIVVLDPLPPAPIDDPLPPAVIIDPLPPELITPAVIIDPLPAELITPAVINPPMLEEIQTISPPTSRTQNSFVDGYVYDADKGGSLQQASMQIFDAATGQPFTDQVDLIDGYYNAWTDRDPATIILKFSAKGYSDTMILFSELIINPDVPMKRGSKAILWLGAGLLLFLLAKRKNKKKVGKIETGDIITIGMGVTMILGFSFIQKILEALGIWDSKKSKTLDDYAQNPDTFWNPNWWQTIKPSNANWTYAITESTAKTWNAEIYGAMNFANDCEECVKAVFHRCRTKANVSFMSWAFNKVYGQDMLTWLRGGNWPQDRLSDADVYEITKWIENLPDY